MADPASVARTRCHNAVAPGRIQLDSIGKIRAQERGAVVAEETGHVGRVQRVAHEQPVAPEMPQLARPHVHVDIGRLIGDGVRVPVTLGLGEDAGDELGDVVGPIGGPREVARRRLLLEDRRQERLVVRAEIGRPVVGNQESARRGVVEIDHGRGEVLPAQGSGGADDVVPGHDPHRAALDDHGTQLPKATQARGDRLEVASSGILRMEGEARDRDDEGRELRRDVLGYRVRLDGGFGGARCTGCG
jgi:hypothetical protein